jgi:hydroxymethylbilane synthase
MTKEVRIGSRRSKMALAQVDYVEQKLLAACPNLVVCRKELSCPADFIKGSLQGSGGKGAFVSTLDQALLNNEIDISVNCMKDIPNDHERISGVCIAGVLPRESTEDVLVLRVGESSEKLFKGIAKVGSSAPRRVAQVLRTYPDWQVVPMRGNVDTRLAKLDQGEVDVLVLAKSGLERLGLSSRISMVLPIQNFPPAFGQGIITLDCRVGDTATQELISLINHQATCTIMKTERAFLNQIKGSCHTAIAGWANFNANNLSLKACVYSNDGRECLSAVLDDYDARDYEKIASDLLNILRKDGLSRFIP